MSILETHTPKSREDYLQWQKAINEKFKIVIDHVLPPIEPPLERLHEAMRYIMGSGGKRIRPQLLIASGQLVNASEKNLYLIASAVECIHVYSLVHDDMPCMDDDDLRRGRPTCHIKYDEATALLVGDALQTYAFELLTSHSLGLNPQQQLGMIQLLAQASGSRGMAGGQAIDCEHVNKPLSYEALKEMHSMKTGALIRASVLLGASAGDDDHRLSVSQWENLDEFAKTIGLAFQVVDDVLDVICTSDMLGKTAGKDMEDNKPTFVSCLGLKEAEQYSRDLKNHALDLLKPFGEKANRLAQITEFIVERRF